MKYLKRTSQFTSTLVFSMIMLLLMVSGTQAQQDPPSSSLTGEEVVLLENDNIVYFDSLGFDGFTLNGPSDTVRLYLAIPADWQLIEGVEVQLDILTFISNGRSATDDGVYGGGVLIEFNGELLDSVELVRNGPQHLRLTVPVSALESQRADGRFPLDITLTGDRICDFERGINVVIQPTSRFILPNEKTTPITDLTQLPRPFYQRSFLPDEVTLVVPASPTADTLQAALTVAAGFGKMGSSRLTLMLTPVDELDPNVRDRMHLIFVGQQADFEMLQAVTLPPLPTENVVENAGVLQTAVSPWNSSKIIMVVSGDNDIALNKAAQAISSGTIRTEVRKDVAIIEKVDPARIALAAPQALRSFAELGYNLELLQGRGSIRTDIDFSIPPGHVIEEGQDAVLNLQFSHSALLDYARSSISVILNGEPIGSVRFSDETTNQGRAEIVLPEGAMHTGRNQITLHAELAPLRSCNDLADSSWLAIRSESTLYLPLTPSEARRMDTYTLSQYPQPFTLDATLATTAFVLPVNDAAAWNSAAQIALDLGNRVNGMLTDLRVAFADDIPLTVQQNYDLLIVGQAATLPILMELSDELPAPFEPGNSRVLDEQLPITYHVPAGVGVGYLELLRSPWNTEHIILAVLGDSAEGLQYAQTALLQSGPRGRMASDFAVADQYDVYVALKPSNLIEMSEAGDSPSTDGAVVAADTDVDAVDSGETAVADGVAQVVSPSPEDVIEVVIEPTTAGSNNTPNTSPVENNSNVVAGAQNRVEPPTPLPNIPASNGAETLPTVTNTPAWVIPTGIGAASILIIILAFRFRRRPIVEPVKE